MRVIPELTGFLPETEQHDDGCQRRPLSTVWITEELLEETQRVWSPLYGRKISNNEAVEMLTNVKRFAEVLLTIKQRREDK